MIMKREIGNKKFPIWLLGDSEPKNWRNDLEFPFDPRHPIRHGIWTSVLEVIQDQIFRKLGKRIDTTSIYIRNAMGDPSKKPDKSSVNWEQSIKDEIIEFKKLIDENNPKMILCFGAFSYEFARRAIGQQPFRKYDYWRAENLGDEFRINISQFDLNATNLIPMLHRVISGGKFLQAHEYFCGKKGANFFEFSGTEIAKIILNDPDKLQIWIKYEKL